MVKGKERIFWEGRIGRCVCVFAGDFGFFDKHWIPY